MSSKLKVGFLMFPYMTALDLTGPAEVLSLVDGNQLYFVAKDLAPVVTEATYSILPTHTFETCPQLDLLCVPGGPGQQRIMHDESMLQWLARQGQGAVWVTSVCSGSLLLGAAGLLRGYRAASHWNYREYLEKFGALPDPARVVHDRNRITGGGVTAGIDFALQVVATIHGEQEAKDIQLMLEYAPQPPFASGTPEEAGSEAVVRVKARLASAVKRLSGESRIASS
jgi:cyclohexyl-isocyanide hydratase